MFSKTKARLGPPEWERSRCYEDEMATALQSIHEDEERVRAFMSRVWNAGDLSAIEESCLRVARFIAIL